MLYISFMLSFTTWVIPFYDVMGEHTFTLYCMWAPMMPCGYILGRCIASWGESEQAELVVARVHKSLTWAICAHVLACPCERAEEVKRDECAIRFVGVRGGYKAMNDDCSIHIWTHYCTMLQVAIAQVKAWNVHNTVWWSPSWGLACFLAVH